MGIKKEEAFTSIYALIMIFSLSTVILATGMFSLIQSKYITTVKNKYELKLYCKNICKEIEKDFQKFIYKENDFENDNLITELKYKYSPYSLSIEDVSTGLNLNTLDKKFLSQKPIKNLLLVYQDSITTDYGWLNSSCTRKDLTDELYDLNKDYPLINNLPVFNINFMNQDFIEAILKICSVSESETKAAILSREKGFSLTKDKIIEILEMSDSKKVLALIGVKTNFWKIIFKYKDCKCEGIIAAYPKRNSTEIEKYVLVDFIINYEAEL